MDYFNSYVLFIFNVQFYHYFKVQDIWHKHRVMQFSPYCAALEDEELKPVKSKSLLVLVKYSVVSVKVTLYQTVCPSVDGSCLSCK